MADGLDRQQHSVLVYKPGGTSPVCPAGSAQVGPL